MSGQEHGPATGYSNESLRALSEAADRELADATVWLREAEAALADAHRTRAEGSITTEKYLSVEARRDAAKATKAAAQARCDDITAHNGGPVPGLMVAHLGAPGRFGVVISGGLVFIRGDESAVDQFESVADLLREGQNLVFTDPLAEGSSVEDRLRLLRAVQRLGDLGGDTDVYSVLLWRYMSDGYRLPRGIQSMSALRSHIRDGRLADALDDWFSEDSLRAAAAATGI